MAKDNIKNVVEDIQELGINRLFAGSYEIYTRRRKALDRIFPTLGEIQSSLYNLIDGPRYMLGSLSIKKELGTDFPGKNEVLGFINSPAVAAFISPDKSYTQNGNPSKTVFATPLKLLSRDANRYADCAASPEQFKEHYAPEIKEKSQEMYNNLKNALSFIKDDEIVQRLNKTHEGKKVLASLQKFTAQLDGLEAAMQGPQNQR